MIFQAPKRLNPFTPPERVRRTLSVTCIEPRDELEAMLAAQMAEVHDATMSFARQLKNVEQESVRR